MAISLNLAHLGGDRGSHQTNTHCVRSVADAFSQSGAFGRRCRSGRHYRKGTVRVGSRNRLQAGGVLESFGIPLKERGRRAKEALGVVRRLLEGESVSLKSGFFNLRTSRITPQPTQKPRPPIWLGGLTRAALRRTVRYGDGFNVPNANAKFMTTM